MVHKFLDSTTVGFLVAAILCFVVVWFIKGLASAWTATKSGLFLFLRYSILIALSMVIAGLFQVLVPRDLITKYLGEASGLKGLSLAALVGALTPGSPYSAMPLFAALMKMGASVPAGVAMVCGWGLVSIGRIPYQAAVLGTRFTFVQVVASLLLPIIAGALAALLARL